VRGMLLREGVGLLGSQRCSEAADLTANRDEGSMRLENDPLNRRVNMKHDESLSCWF
jgi:hypothetical protein